MVGLPLIRTLLLHHFCVIQGSMYSMRMYVQCRKKIVCVSTPPSTLHALQANQLETETLIVTAWPATVYTVQWMYYMRTYLIYMYVATYVAVCTNSHMNEIRLTLCCESHLTQLYVCGYLITARLVTLPTLLAHMYSHLTLLQGNAYDYCPLLNSFHDFTLF